MKGDHFNIGEAVMLVGFADGIPRNGRIVYPGTTDQGMYLVKNYDENEGVIVKSAFPASRIDKIERWTFARKKGDRHSNDQPASQKGA